MELTPPDPPLADDRVDLRAWTEEDVPAIVAACRDPDTARWTTVPIPYTEQDARQWLERCADAWERGMAPFAVVERDAGELAAAISMWLQGPVAELGYWTVPGYRGQGLVPRAVRLVTRWCFDDLGVARVQLGTFPGNRASERVAEKCGFTREGVLRAWADQRGDRRDMTMWSVLPGELV